jgi:hypothetical protein
VFAPTYAAVVQMSSLPMVIEDGLRKAVTG